MRQIILDTETTGMEPKEGHRLIEIGCLEMENRRLTGRNFHYYLNPDREIDAEASEVHGIYLKDLMDKPRFADIADEFLAFLDGAELIIHNAAFDIGFINHEFRQLKGESWPGIAHYCRVLDSLIMARRRHPGQKNNLDALARRYGVDQRDRRYHGALLDSEILADVYLAMTGGQVGLALGQDDGADGVERTLESSIRRLPANRPRLPVLRATPQELESHQVELADIDKASNGSCLWRNQDPA